MDRQGVHSQIHTRDIDPLIQQYAHNSSMNSRAELPDISNQAFSKTPNPSKSQQKVYTNYSVPANKTIMDQYSAYHQQHASKLDRDASLNAQYQQITQSFQMTHNDKLFMEHTKFQNNQFSGKKPPINKMSSSTMGSFVNKNTAGPNQIIA